MRHQYKIIMHDKCFDTDQEIIKCLTLEEARKYMKETNHYQQIKGGMYYKEGLEAEYDWRITRMTKKEIMA